MEVALNVGSDGMELGLLTDGMGIGLQLLPICI